MTKILIADDQQLIRESLKIILDTDKDFDVIDVVGNGKDALESIEANKPDVVLMDVRMPQMDGVECTRIIKQKYPEISVIILTTFDDDEYIYDAIKNGAAIFNPNVAKKLTSFFSQMANNPEHLSWDKDGLPDLSENEWKIIEQIGHGLSNKEIASLLQFSEGTIRNYLSVILDKLGLRDRTQLAIWYLKKGRK